MYYNNLMDKVQSFDSSEYIILQILLFCIHLHISAFCHYVVSPQDGAVSYMKSQLNLGFHEIFSKSSVFDICSSEPKKFLVKL